VALEHSRTGVNRVNNALRPYRGRLKAVILDWAGTTVDHGSLAPVRVLQKIFSDRGIKISEEEARRDMGVLKKDHIRALLRVPRITAEWKQRYQQTPGEKEVEALFGDFIPQQMACLVECSNLISGVTDTVLRLRARGLTLGSTTGYSRPLMESVVKIGDTISDIEEGLNAGTWSVGVARTGNMIGLTEEQWQALPLGEQKDRLQVAHQQLLNAGAHWVIDTLAEIHPILDQIEARLQAGDRP